MSIVALKRKTLTQYNNMSTGQPQFSLNGTRRIQGYVGQNIISRNLQKTPVKHSGGCCGKYPVGHVVLNGLTSMDDVTVVRPSVMNTSGLIEMKYNYKWLRRPYPCSIVKPDTTINSNTQGSYVSILSNNCSIYEKQINTHTSGCSQEKCVITKDITNDPNIINKVAATQSMYLFRKQKQCTSDNVFNIPHNWNGGPIQGSH